MLGKGPLARYNELLAKQILQVDLQQLKLVRSFQNLYNRVGDYRPPDYASLRTGTVLEGLRARYNTKPIYPEVSTRALTFAAKNNAWEAKSPRGLLVNGGVGCGKTMIMDMFVHENSQRWHYSNFMLWLHHEIHTRSRVHRKQQDDILMDIAKDMISKYILLIDEFMLQDVGSAKMVSTLFTHFFELGGVLVATSNRKPEDLYAMDFKKTEFVEFFTLLQYRCEDIEMVSDVDYRRRSHTDNDRLIISDHEKMDRVVKELMVDPQMDDSLVVYGRKVKVPCASDGVVKFQFKQLCATPQYGTADYISMASNYHTFIIDNVPTLTLDMKNEARRFITLLDALYDSKCQLVLHLDTSPDLLFFPSTRSHRSLIQVANSDATTYNDTMSAEDEVELTGEDEKFAYKRAVSRILEMTGSVAWSEQKWVPAAARPWERKK